MSKRLAKPSLIWTVDRVLAARGMSAYALAKAVQGISENTAYRAARPGAAADRATGKTVVALCVALDCTPGDILAIVRKAR